MHQHRPQHANRASARLIALAAGIIVILAGCSSQSTSIGGSNSAKVSPVQGGTVTFAENPASGAADYIFPMVSLSVDTPTNLQFQYLMYRPLLWFGKGSEPTRNPDLSLAEEPVYQDGNTTVVIHLKPYQWSDGKPLTSRDVLFWINLLRANTDNWAAYLPGGFPDNVTSATAPDALTVQLKLNKAYNPDWFTQTQLAQIFPLPQHAWDKTSASAPVGDYDLTKAGGKAVRNYLDAEAKDISTYTTNPLWKVVDGPWTLDVFRSDGYAEFSPNANYSGPRNSNVTKFIMKPFTSETAEFNVLRSGGLTYGFVPLTDLSQKSVLESLGYVVKPWASWSISYFVLNFNNPTVGPILRQLYVRQAMEKLIDQDGYIKAFLKGSGVRTNGPAPVLPANQFASSQMQAGFYKYDPAGAVALLHDHGWNVHPNGTTTCIKPGIGSSQCGKGIKAGAQLSFNLQYLSGVGYLDQEIKAYKSALLQAGIQLNLSKGSEGQVVGTATACAPSPSCSWQMVQWGSPSWIWPSAYPSGEAIFATGAGVNAGSYSDKINDANIAAVETSNGTTKFYTYANYLGQQLPVLWLPNTYNQISAIKKNLSGAEEQSPLLFINPELWSVTH
jgi:peptide/nickel transport system substrate-binding protein